MRTNTTLSRTLFSIAPLLLTVFAGQAAASEIQFQVDYSVTAAAVSCSQPGSPLCNPSGLPFPPLTVGDTFQKTFSLDSSQLAHDGSYSVAGLVFGLGGWAQMGSLSPAFPLFQPAPPIVSTTQSLTVDAIVSAGAVSDLSIDFNDSASGGPASSNESFHASGGTWSESSFFQLVGAGPSDSASGAYTITQLTSVPEPAPGWLIFVGLASAAIFKRRRRA